MRSNQLYVATLSASLLLALIPTLWPSVDLAVAGFFLRPDAPLHPANWWWVDAINEYTPNTFRALALASLLAWGLITLSTRLLPRFAPGVLAPLWPRLRRYSLPLAFVGLAVSLGPGLATWAAKEATLRARPLDVVEFGGTRAFARALVSAQQCSDNCAFTSGHAACGFFLASLMWLDPRRRARWLLAGIVAGAAVSFARVSVGAHWLSDVLWAFPVTLVVSGLVWQVLMLFYPPPRSTAQ